MNPVINSVNGKALLYAIPIFLTPFGDKIVPILFEDQWPSLQKSVGCSILGLIAATIAVRAYYDGSAERRRIKNEETNMKNKTTLLGLLLIASIVIITGCAQQHVNPAQTDPVTGVITPATTNYTPNPIVGQVTGMTTAIAPLIPNPWGGVITAVSVLAAAIAGGIARYKNAQVVEKQTQLKAVIMGVEQANNPQTKIAIQDIATALGANDKLHQTVQAVVSVLPSSSK